MADICAFPRKGNSSLSFDRGYAARTTGANSSPIFTAIPLNHSAWAIKAIAPSGAVNIIGRFDGRLAALGAAVLMAAHARGQVLP